MTLPAFGTHELEVHPTGNGIDLVWHFAKKLEFCNSDSTEYEDSQSASKVWHLIKNQFKYP